MGVVNTRSPSGDPVLLKERRVIPTGVIPTPFTISATLTMPGVVAGDGVALSPSQALPPGIFLGGALAGDGVITVYYGAASGATVTLTAGITADIYVTKGGADL